MKARLTPLIIATVLAATACQTDIDFDYHQIDPITVIEANLTTTYTSVIITETTPVDEPINRSRITDASVHLTDITTADTRTLTPDAEGVYTDNQAGIPGHTYAISVVRGKETFKSSCTMLMPVVIVDFKFIKVQTPVHSAVVGQVVFLDPPQTRGDCYIVRFFRNGELYTLGTISDIQVTAEGLLLASFTAVAAQDMPADIVDKDEKDHFINDGDIFTASVTPVSRAYYDYLVALNSGSNGPQMFEGDFCLGYFLAAPESEITRTFYHSDLVDFSPKNY